MQLLKERIIKEGKVLPGDIVKVDGFLNHKLDTKLFGQIAEEFKKHLDVDSATLILTAEASGIALAAICGSIYNLPVLYAKKAKSDNIEGGLYKSEIVSYTYKKKTTLIVSKEWLKPEDKVLIIDDFMANGFAVQGLVDIVNEAGATVVGIGIAVEKGFQPGGDKFRHSNIPYKALAVIDKIDDGKIIFREDEKTENDIAECKLRELKDCTIKDFVDKQIKEIKEQVGDKKVLLALSGGVDSSVTAAILSKAIGKNLYCVFVNHGLLRKGEVESVCSVFGEGNKNFDLNFIYVDAAQRYYKKLANVVDPEQKRKIIGEEFIRIFEEEAKKLGKIDFLAQGTIYPDIIESGSDGKGTVKSHHNVGGLPKDIGFEGLVEPLKYLYKDEVRKVGSYLGLPKENVNRQPFPGPGLGVRIVGEITEEKVRMVQEADYIFREEIIKAGLDKGLAQFFAALTNIRSVGVRDGERTYEYAVSLRAVITKDFMTAVAAELPYDLLFRVMDRIQKEVKGVSRVLYDLSSKPFATIELE